LLYEVVVILDVLAHIDLLGESLGVVYHLGLLLGNLARARGGRLGGDHLGIDILSLLLEGTALGSQTYRRNGGDRLPRHLLLEAHDGVERLLADQGLVLLRIVMSSGGVRIGLLERLIGLVIIGI